MRRRSFLAAIGTVGLVTGAGCGSGLTGPIEQRRFEICDNDCDWAENTPGPGEDPIVERFPDDRRVVVYGNMYVGSSSCDRAVLESVELRESTLRLVVGVGDKNPIMGGCTADMGTDRYRATVRLREELPANVVVEEQAAYDPEHSETETETETETTDGA